MQDNSYYDSDSVEERVAAGLHREVIGGLWEELGQLQLDFLMSRGLEPHHRLIDVGCGSLRGGVHFIPYLDSGNYFGLDLNYSLIEAGIEKELKPLALESKVPRGNLQVSDNFDFALFPESFHFAVAISLFTHLKSSSIRHCLEKLATHMEPEGRFYATFFEGDQGNPATNPVQQQPGGVVTYGDQDPYHYHREDIEYLASSSGWTAEWIGDFGHPRNQKMVLFRLK